MKFTRSVLTTSAFAALALGATTALAVPASAAPNTTPQKVCGSGYKTVNS
ncbi:spore-associated protein, partial [Streptomyces sp. NPDC059990]